MQVFDNNYNILKNQNYAMGNYSIVPIRYEDRFSIMKWRNEQIYHLRQHKPLTEEDQERYFKDVVSKIFDEELPKQLLFSYLHNDICIGYGGLVHINWIDKNAEVSFIMDTVLEKDSFHFHWKTYLSLIENVAYKEIGLHKIFTYAFDIRPHLYEALESAGYIKEAILKEHCLFEGKFRDVVIHSKWNDFIKYRLITYSDKSLLLEWSNDEETRKNSFNSNPISAEDHETWFDSKVNSKASYYYICEIESSPCGIVKFDYNNKKTVIGIIVAPNFRNKGLAKKMLEGAIAEYKRINDAEIYSYIKKENLASIKSFEKAGFIYNEDIIINNFDSKEYILQ